MYSPDVHKPSTYPCVRGSDPLVGPIPHNVNVLNFIIFSSVFSQSWEIN